MARYYYSNDKKEWKESGNEYDVFMNIINGKIILDDFIWHPNMCQSNLNHPSKCRCGAAENAKRIRDTDILPLELFQIEGTINHYDSKIHSGTQPIRVLNHMLGLMFVNTHPGFPQALFKEMDNGVFTKGVFPILGEEPLTKESGGFHTPFVDAEKNVTIHETFLSYLWGITYSVYALFLETIDFPQLNLNYGYIKYPIREENISKAYELFNYVKSLIRIFEKWDIELPNPEMYPANTSDRIYIEQTAMYYTEAVKFILCHEFTHAQRHIDKIALKDVPISHFLEFEKEADENAIQLLKKGMVSNFNAEVVEIGIVIAVLSMFFFRKTTVSTKHPNSEDRLTAVLENLKLKDSHPAWGIACIGLKLWDGQFTQNFIWNAGLLHREQYYDIVLQIKDRH